MPASSWKQEVSQRLAAHQNRRMQFAAKQASPVPSRNADSRAAQAAARVAARFAHAPSYSQMQELKPGSERSAATSALPEGVAPKSRTQEQEGRPNSATAPGKATCQAFQIADARLDTEGLRDSKPRIATDAKLEAAAPMAATEPWLWKPETLWAAAPVRSSTRDSEPVLAPTQPAAPASLDAWESELSRRGREPDFALRPIGGAAARAPRRAESYTRAVAVALAEPEPAWMEPQQSQGEEDTDSGPAMVGFESVETAAIEAVEPDHPIQANLIEFPRELVAPRKMRPRLAEAARSGQEQQMQLSIFEVDPAALSLEPEAAAPAWPQPEWSGIELEDLEAEAREEEFEEGAESGPKLQLASIERRLMAALVDGALSAVAFLGAAVTATASMSHPPGARIAEICAVVALLAAGMLYHALFLMLGETTPGMRYARISLCTFDGMRPTRGQFRSRLGALPLSLLPMGLGLAWMLFDEDRLSWHDRLSKTYPREY